MKIYFYKWYKQKNPIYWLVGLATFGKYNHCSVELQSGFIYEAVSSGVLVNTKHQVNQFGLCDVIEVPKKLLPNIAEAESWAMDKIGASYDWKGIFLSEIFPLGKSDAKKYFCSEIIVKMLDIAGMDLDAVANETSPNRLYSLLQEKLNEYEELEDNT